MNEFNRFLGDSLCTQEKGPTVFVVRDRISGSQNLGSADWVRHLRMICIR